MNGIKFSSSIFNLILLMLASVPVYINFSLLLSPWLNADFAAVILFRWHHFVCVFAIHFHSMYLIWYFPLRQPVFYSIAIASKILNAFSSKSNIMTILFRIGCEFNAKEKSSGNCAKRVMHVSWKSCVIQKLKFDINDVAWRVAPCANATDIHRQWKSISCEMQ